MKIKVGNKFDWDTDDLDAWVDENRDDLEMRVVEQSRTIRLLNTLTGIKGTQNLNDIDTNITWQSGAACGFNPGGDDVFGVKSITVADIKFEKEYCNKDLIGFWPQTTLASGSAAELESLPFEAKLVNDMLAKNALRLDTAIWKGDTTSLNVNLNRFDGLLKQLNADNSVVDLNTGNVTSITSSNALTVFKDAVDAVPASVIEQPGFNLVAGYETMRKLLRNIADVDSMAGMRHYTAEEAADGLPVPTWIEIPGTFVKVWYVPGLSGTDYVVSGIFGANGKVYFGTDAAGEQERMKSGYDERLESLWFRCRFRAGTTYRFGAEMGLLKTNNS